MSLEFGGRLDEHLLRTSDHVHEEECDLDEDCSCDDGEPDFEQMLADRAEMLQ